MDIYKYISKVLIDQQETEAIILEIYETGSQLFIENPWDLDYKIIIKDYKQENKKHYYQEGSVAYDFILIDSETFCNQLDFNNKKYNKSKLFNYFFHFRKSIYGSFTWKWNMLEHKTEYLEYLKERFDYSLLQERFKYNCGKDYVHYYTIFKIFENNSTVLTKEVKENIVNLYNKINNYKEIIDWVIKKISAL